MQWRCIVQWCRTPHRALHHHVLSSWRCTRLKYEEKYLERKIDECWCGLPERVSHNLHVLSILPVTIRLQSQLNCALLTSAVWPIRVWIFLRDEDCMTISTFLSSFRCLRASANIPDGDRTIEGSSDHLITSRVETNRYNFTCMALFDGSCFNAHRNTRHWSVTHKKRGYLGAGDNIPQLGCMIHTASDQNRALRIECQAYLHGGYPTVRQWFTMVVHVLFRLYGHEAYGNRYHALNSRCRRFCRTSQWLFYH